MRPSVIAAAVLSLSFIHARVATAQTLRPASTIRITTRGTQIQGRFIVANAGSLVMETDGKPASTIATSDITQLEVRSSHAGEGAKVLGVTGLITGAALGAMVVTGMCETSNCNDDVLPAMGAVGLTFGAIGALGGAVIGSMIPQWKSVDPTRIGVASSRLSAAPTFRMRGANDREIGLRFALRP